MPRRHSVTLYGATGFVGRQTVAHFARHAPSGMRWALAGRDAARLEQVRAAVGATDAGIVVADAQDTAALDALAAASHVVLSTAGPFARYGSALVEACVRQRTHYVDITGETPWVRGLIDRHHAQAAADGTRIVPCCGFDSVPSDLGAWLVAQALWQRERAPCVQVKAMHSVMGGFNGGTLASALNLMDTGAAKALADPFLLNPPGSVTAVTPFDRDPLLPAHDADFDAWVGPFFMGPVNTRVVRRSAALLQADGDAVIGTDFHYQEWMRYGRSPAAGAVAAGVTAGLAGARLAMSVAPARWLARRVLPPPGAGPSERQMDDGWFRCELVGRTAQGATARASIAGRGDPGNRATTIFVCEAALALASDRAALPGGARRGGVLTPATALGAVLARRLRAAGMTVEPQDPATAPAR